MTTHYHAVVVGTRREPLGRDAVVPLALRARVQPTLRTVRQRLRRALPVPDGRGGRGLRPVRLRAREPGQGGPLRSDRGLAVVVQPATAPASTRASRSPRRSARGPPGPRSRRLPRAPARATRPPRPHLLRRRRPAPAPRTRTRDPSRRSRLPRTLAGTAVHARAQAPPRPSTEYTREISHSPRARFSGRRSGASPQCEPRGVRHVEHPVVVLARLDQLPRPVEQRHAALPLLRARLGAHSSTGSASARVLDLRDDGRVGQRRRVARAAGSRRRRAAACA